MCSTAQHSKFFPNTAQAPPPPPPFLPVCTRKKEKKNEGKKEKNYRVTSHDGNSSNVYNMTTFSHPPKGQKKKGEK